MSVKIFSLTNANVWIDGGSALGIVRSFDAPNVQYKMGEHNALGMIGTTEYFSGIEKMEGTIRWTSVYPEFYKKFSNPFEGIRLQVRGQLDQYQGGTRVAQQACVVYMTVIPKSAPLGSYQPKENVELETSYTCTYVRLEVAGEPIVEIDVEANIFSIGGSDMLAQYRSNLGI